MEKYRKDPDEHDEPASDYNRMNEAEQNDMQNIFPKIFGNGHIISMLTVRPTRQG